MSDTSTALSATTRRIVTGHDDSAKSQIIYDDASGKLEMFPNGSCHTVWFSDEVPADCSSATDVDPTGSKTFQLSNNGSVCMIVSLAPGGSSPMHQTKSLDYAVILEGEVELELDNGEKRLIKTGDVVVQRETNHAWHNRHLTKTAKFFIVLIASKQEVESKAEMN